jgi:uncharacterized repeat protein (TIGR01451 family)
MRKVFVILAGVLFAVFGGVRLASAGPIIIDGTDANEHGHVVGTNQEGWKYMQEALEHLSQEVYTGTARTVVDLGTTPVSCPAVGHDARDAINSAFELSSLPGDGWTLIHVDTAVSITRWLRNLSPVNTGILYIPTYNNLCGDLWHDEMDAINANPAAIANFVNGPGDPSQGGALFAMSERDTTPVTPTLASMHESAMLTPSAVQATKGYLWLQSIIPGLVATGFSAEHITSISLTVDGFAAFPGLTDADVSSGPWHNWFEGNLGSLKVLATAPDESAITRTVILGGGKNTQLSPGAGTITATKTGTLLTDADTDGVISPGDTLQYLVHIHNNGSEVITDVVFTDTPDPNTSLVVGSVQATTGTITLGNNSGDTTVRVEVGVISSSQSVDIQYDAVITNPFPSGVVTVTNQGVVSTTTGTTPTTDPVNPGPTVITVTKTAEDGIVSLSVVSSVGQCVLPGSSYFVTWTVQNNGDVVFPGDDITTLVTGSGSAPISTTIPEIPTGTASTVTQTILVSEPVAYGAEVITLTGTIVTSTAVLTTPICAPDFRTSAAHVTSQPIFIGEMFTYTWQISNTGTAAAPGVTGVLTLPVHALFSYQNNLTSTFGLPSYDPISSTISWTGDLGISETVTITFNARTGFGFPHGLIEAPFEVDHPYRPPFLGVTQYTYPYKLFFMLVLKDSSPTSGTR